MFKKNHSIHKEDVTTLIVCKTGVYWCRKMHILYKGEYSCYLGKEKNVKGCFPCEQYSVVHVSHGNIGISRASTIKRIQNILGKVEWYLHRNNGFKGIFSKLYNYNDHLSCRTSKFLYLLVRTNNLVVPDSRTTFNVEPCKAQGSNILNHHVSLRGLFLKGLFSPLV